ncbi:MAG: hypothetical protein RLO22_24240 [Sneathiellaceae bacterium]
MNNLPEFSLYGDGDPNIESAIQPNLDLRHWNDLKVDEKKIAIQYLKNKKWLNMNSKEVLITIEYLNDAYLRQCPGKNLYNILPHRSRHGGESVNESERKEAAYLDFQSILLSHPSNELVYRMISRMAKEYIDKYDYKMAASEEDSGERNRLISSSFRQFDRFCKCINHLFSQFSVNQMITRTGFVPRQDEIIAQNIYIPTLRALSDPRWRSVNTDLAEMFEDYQSQNYPEVVTKAHRAVQRFLQIITEGEEGKGGKGEVGKLFSEAKRMGVISTTRFSEGIIQTLQSYIPSERATKSTAKPSTTPANHSDALLMMNVVMVFLQHCMQNGK